ncbi:MarC family protein [Rhizobium ruizarguesonis]|uniref:MarC family protein n=1 Tax=Rhizobium ruizarguesonis TaxID=2081791 RepID=UPI001030E6B7|nr:MarC family protein [Rhizobium ruizarguesonis]TBA81084.1 MarC family protein [Rhizobium ruizarguesonis]TBA85788.1 MarC family protein [Rhizobium ruizarguesonis]TBB23182.1 MarC family protein [Rhizobium ruizarguesonis]TBC29943.1 MarC family protein [Rhizobium ruizarguesonis]
MDFTVIDAALVAKLFLLLAVGLGPKIALVPFLEKTHAFDAETKARIGRQMVLVATVTALILFATGALLMRLLHITNGAVAVAGGIILALIAIKMASGPTEKPHEETGLPVDPEKIAVFPLAVPYLLNPVGITVVLVASGGVVSIASAILVIAVILVVAALDYVVFTNIDVLAKRMKPASLIVSEVVFGILLTAVAVQLVVNGLGRLGIITPTAAH